MSLSPRVSLVLRFAAVLAVLGLLWVLVPVDELRALMDPDALRARGDAGGAEVYLTFFGASILMMLMTGQLALPVIAGATLFGALLGPVVAVLGVSFGATGQFLLVRYALREPAQAVLSRRAPRLQTTIEERGLGLLILLRLIWFPTFLVNVGTALTRMPLRRFVAAFPAMLPQAFIFAYATDAVVVHGWSGVPLSTWLTLIGMVAAGVGAYLVAMKRWPHLRALSRGEADADEV